MTPLDEKNHNLFKFYGAKAKEYRQKCIGLLPAIFKSKIYKQKGFESIFEYAAKLAGMSQELVKRVLSLNERFQETPTLQNLLTEGKVSVHKLARIASVATAGNEDFWATQVQILHHRELETLIRDERVIEANKDFEMNLQIEQTNVENKNGLQETLFDQNFVHVHKSGIENNQREMQLASLQDVAQLNFNKAIVKKLLELQIKGININELILNFLEKREREIAQKKEEIAEEILEKRQKDSNDKNLKQQLRSSSRYIPTKIKKIIYQEYGTKCSISSCNKPSTQIHHTQRFSLSQNHDPHYLAPLCKEHHVIAHSIDIKFQKFRDLK